MNWYIGKVLAAVIEFGGFLGIGTRKIAVEWSALRIEADRSPVAILDVTREQLRLAPEYKPCLLYTSPSPRDS